MEKSMFSDALMIVYDSDVKNLQDVYKNWLDLLCQQTLR